MNAKKELLHRTPKENIKCAFLIYKPSYSQDDDQHIILKDEHTQKELAKFLKKLNFEYDSGFGAQYLHGTVWLNDGSWIERREYDGSEWWSLQTLPPIPDECRA